MKRKMFRSLGADPAILRFVGLFFVLVLALTVALKAPWTDEHLVRPYTGFLAQLSRAILSLVGTPVHVNGDTLIRGGFALAIRRGCDGLEAAVLLISACMAYPSSWRARLMGTLAGYGLIFILNLIRIVGLALIAFSQEAASFEFFHVYVSQFAVIALTMVFWIFWAGKQKPVGQ